MFSIHAVKTLCIKIKYFWLHWSKELVSEFSYIKDCVIKLSIMPVWYSELLRVILQGALVTAMQGVAPHVQILSKIQTSGPVFTISKLSNHSSLKDRRSSSHYTLNFTQLFWKTNTIWQIFQETLLALIVAVIQSPF